MKKRKILLSLTIFSIALASISVIYAVTSKNDLTNIAQKNIENDGLYICISEENVNIKNEKKKTLFQRLINIFLRF